MGNVVIVGGTQGQGRELARSYAEEGRDVIVAGRDKSRADTAGLRAIHHCANPDAHQTHQCDEKNHDYGNETTIFGHVQLPPTYSLWLDTRFLTADASAVAHTIEGVVGPDSELVELVWVPIEEATHLDMPTITGIILEELLARVEAGMGHQLPVPYYYMIEQQFFRELL